MPGGRVADGDCGQRGAGDDQPDVGPGGRVTLLDEAELTQRGEEPAHEDRERGEVAEARPRQQVHGPGSEVGGYEERSEEVPGPVERRTPAQGRPEELGAGADAIPEQAQAPDGLEAASPPPPLLQDQGSQSEACARRQERKHHVRRAHPAVGGQGGRCTSEPYPRAKRGFPSSSAAGGGEEGAGAR